jgi:hypothetical protein
MIKLILRLAAVTLTGCSGVIYEYSPATGQVIEKTRVSSKEDIIYRSIDSHLQDELDGRLPPGGNQEWRRFWESRISAWRSYNHPQYERYLARRRRELHLKALTD